MLIQHGNVTSRVLECTEEEYELFRDIFTFVVPNYFFADSFRRGLWDGKYRFFRGKTFPTGLTFLLQEKLSITVRKPRSRKQVDIKPDVLKSKFMAGKYAYQFEVVQQVLREETGLWHLATNSGKTLIAAALLQILSQKALFLVHSKDLLTQAYNVFTEEMSLPIGRLGAGVEDIATVTIGMPQTIVNRMKRDPVKSWLESVEVVIVDECHLASATTWQTVLKSCTNARYRYGLSGTPLDRGELENLKVMAYLGPVIARVTNEELINYGVSSIPHVEFIRVVHSSVQEEYPKIYDECVVNNYARNMKIVELTTGLVNNGEIVLILVKRVVHGEILCQMFRQQNLVVEFRSGESTSEEREKSFQSLREAKTQVLIVSRIGEVGLDIPSITAMIRASGGKSTVSTLQYIGRGLRNPTEGVNHIHFYDFLDEGVEYLHNHSLQRKEDYERENFEVQFR